MGAVALETEEEAGLLGRIAVRNRFITLEQLELATKERGRSEKKLGVVMLEMGMIDELTLGKMLALQQRHLKSLAQRRAREGDRSAAVLPRRKLATPPDWAARRPPDHRSAGPVEAARTADPRRQAATGGRRQAPTGGRRQATTAGRRQATTAGRRQASTAGRRQAPTAGRRETLAGGRRQATTDDHRPSEDGGRRASPAGRAPEEANVVGGEETPPPSSGAPTLRRDRHATPPDAPPPLQREERPTAPDRPRRELLGDIHNHDTKPPKGEEPERPTLPSELGEDSQQETPRSGDDAAGIRIHLQEARAGRSDVAVPSTEPALSVDARAAPELEPRLPPPGATEPLERLRAILEHGATAGASDVHISPDQPVKMRQQGAWQPITDQPLSGDATRTVLSALLNDWQRDRLRARGEVEFVYPVPELGRFRTSVFRHLQGLAGMFHILPAKIPSFDELGLPSGLVKITNHSRGLILITGPRGSGKTTTAAAILNIINDERRDRILTIEDRIEFIIPPRRCTLSQRQVGRDTASYARALRAARREDPDVICIDELHGSEAIALALEAAEGNCLVLATMTARSSVEALIHIVNAFPRPAQSRIRASLSESLCAVLAQRLLPCPEGPRAVPALEILYANRDVSAAIRENRWPAIREVLRHGRADGMILLDLALYQLVLSGRVSRAVAALHCDDPQVLEAP
ncbi:MAG: ATPase, T2SS/T4P/T4SS family [Myxococcota bacterium]